MSRILESMNRTAQALYEAGAMKKKDRDEVKSLYLSSIRPLAPEEIRAIRKKNKLTQALLAAALGVQEITVKKWESGENTPRGPARRLLHLIAQKGIQYIDLEQP